MSAGAAATGAVTEKRVWPSAGCFKTSDAPMVITPPGLFSTTTFQPSVSVSALATMRARISGGVEAEFGTTIRMTFEGNDWADADWDETAPKPAAAALMRNERRSMSSSDRLVGAISQSRASIRGVSLTLATLLIP